MKKFLSMLSPTLFFSGPIFAFFFLLGCSSPESQERIDTTLCWLRPSCLPSQPPQDRTPKAPPASKPSPSPSEAKPKLKKIRKDSSSKGPATPCLTSTKITIQASKPFVTVSYMEPTTKANGQTLTNLAKTTIYHDFGKGLVKYKDIPATNPQGGGKIQEKVSFSIGKRDSIQATICITATNTNGQER